MGLVGHMDGGPAAFACRWSPNGGLGLVRGFRSMPFARQDPDVMPRGAPALGSRHGHYHRPGSHRFLCAVRGIGTFGGTERKSVTQAAGDQVSPAGGGAQQGRPTRQMKRSVCPALLWGLAGAGWLTPADFVWVAADCLVRTSCPARS